MVICFLKLQPTLSCLFVPFYITVSPLKAKRINGLNIRQYGQLSHSHNVNFTSNRNTAFVGPILQQNNTLVNNE